MLYVWCCVDWSELISPEQKLILSWWNIIIIISHGRFNLWRSEGVNWEGQGVEGEADGCKGESGWETKSVGSQIISLKVIS